MMFCPECGSSDIDLSLHPEYPFECLDCGFEGDYMDFDIDEDE